MMVIMCLSGCSSISLLMQGEFDASGYVQGILDSSYKGIFDQYIELTKDTQENAESAYEAVMKTKAEDFANYTAVTLTDETRTKFIDYSKQIYNNAKYEVSDATKTDNGFTVDIVISPILFLEHISSEGEAYVTDFNTRNSNGEFADFTQEQFEAEYAKGIMNILENEIANVQYGEPVTVTVNVTLKDDKLYTMDTDEFTKIDSAILK